MSSFDAFPGRTLRVLAVLAAAAVAPGAAFAVFPGANGKIVYVSTASGNFEVHTMAPDGTAKVNLTQNSADDLDPVWSPDGTRIAFSSSRAGKYGVWVMNADGSGVQSLTPAMTYARYPAWSPDGNRLAFAGQQGTSSPVDLWVMNADGTGAARLTADAAEDSEPAWSPDGRRIAFASVRGVYNDIFVMNADGTGVVNLTQDPTDDSSPDWSPDGSSVAWAASRGGVSAIWTMNPDGSTKKQLTNTPEGDVMPAWSPDGTKIAFASLRGWDFDIYVMNRDGSAPVRLTAPGPGEALPPTDVFPDWQRVEPEVDNRSPVADASAAPQVECTSSQGADVTLNGSASSDPDSTPGTNDDITLFDWLLDFGNPGERLLGSGEILDASLPPGTNVVTLRVTDRAGATSTDEIIVVVADTAPPAIAFQMTPSVLWPPNHQMVPVHASVVASDRCGAVSVRLDSVTSSEPEDGHGDGATAPDIKDANIGTPDFDFLLRAERSGTGSGRIYLIRYTALDAAGNSASAVAQVVVLKCAADGKDAAREIAPKRPTGWERRSGR